MDSNLLSILINVLDFYFIRSGVDEKEKGFSRSDSCTYDVFSTACFG
jgi:hypothetical protein